MHRGYSQLDAKITNFIDNYSLWHNAPKKLPAGNFFGALYHIVIINKICYFCIWLAVSPVHYATSCKHRLVLLRMGEIIARNMLSCLLLSIKFVVVATCWLFIFLCQRCTVTQTSNKNIYFRPILKGHDNCITQLGLLNFWNVSFLLDSDRTRRFGRCMRF